MASQVSMISQRDLSMNLKKESFLNVNLLSKIHPMPPELYRQIFEEKVLEKLTQKIFNHLSYYLINIIDAQRASSFSWPLYDTKVEKAYRNDVSNFISNYSNKNLLSPVMSSFLVNPACYKVTLLIFQLTHLAIQRTLESRLTKEQENHYKIMTEAYSSKHTNIANLAEDLKPKFNKLSTHLKKRQMYENAAEIMKKKIITIEKKINEGQTFLNKIVDNYISNHQISQASKQEIINIKDVTQTSNALECWLKELDCNLDNLESQWIAKMSLVMDTSKGTLSNSKALIARHTGKVNNNSFMVEYNHKTDQICTKDLQNMVNSEQMHVLTNLVQNERLSFPNLLRSFVISVCLILRDTDINEDMHKYNEWLEHGCQNYKEIVISLKALLERVLIVEKKLKLEPVIVQHISSVYEHLRIPSLNDFSDLKITRDHQIQFDSITPMKTYKLQFQLRKNCKSMPLSPLYRPPRENFIKSIMSNHGNGYENRAHNSYNVSIMSQTTNKINETISEGSGGFKKQLITTLLSSKRSCSSEEFYLKSRRPVMRNCEKGKLFNESNTPDEKYTSKIMPRSYSSPELFEIKDKRLCKQYNERKLPIMPEDLSTILDMSGVTSIHEFPSDCYTPAEMHLQRGEDKTSLPMIPCHNDGSRIQNVKETPKKELNDGILFISSTPQSNLESIQVQVKTPEIKKPTTKTSSIEKLISRFNKVRASVKPSDKINESLSSYDKTTKDFY